jgi:hypothetical protein
MMSRKKNVSTEAPTTGTKTHKQTASRPKTKLAQLEAMLRRPDGATVEQISKSLDWQTHSVRGAISGALKKKQGLTITSEKTGAGRRVYRIAA